MAAATRSLHDEGGQAILFFGRTIAAAHADAALAQDPPLYFVPLSDIASSIQY